MADSKEALLACYEFARSGGSGTETKAVASKRIADKCQTNFDSMSMTIDFYRNCLAGAEHTFGFSAQAAEVALENAPDGAALMNTIACLEGHADHKKQGPASKLRKLIALYKPVNMPSQREQERQQDKLDGDACKLSDEEILRLAKEASDGPAERVPVVASAYKRNPYVKLATLKRADGVCERCKKPAPFVHRGDEKEPYLEVHHTIPLSEDGPDTLENTKALCPNCHREAHLGVNWKDFRK